MQVHPVSDKTFRRAITLLAAAAAVLLLTSCSIHESRGGANEAKKVDISTPFGSLHVNAHDVDPKATGIAVYPGATLVEKEQGHDSANVTIDSSMFGLKVVALKFRTNDPPDKVLQYYRDQLKSYGSVLECKGHYNAGGTETVGGDSRELTCGKKSDGININVDSDGTELKVGTTDRQHIVSVKPRADGSEFALVYVQTRGKGDSM
jgi:hypothetical protein